MGNMRRVLMCSIVLWMMIAPTGIVSADENSRAIEDLRLSAYISGVYQQIAFTGDNPLSQDAFSKAYRGYLSLADAGMLNPELQTLTVCDMSRPSTEKRMWVIDIAARKVLFNTYVAHGQGSGDDLAEEFSNRMDSHQSSLGFYVTGDTYDGDHGLSLKLEGVDAGFNDAAMDRGIVVHGAPYVSERFIAENNRLGRSWGCPAVPDELKEPIINAIKGGTCLFIYAPQASYLASSHWLHHRIAAASLPDVNCSEIAMPTKAVPRTRVIEYISNGRVDSVKTIPN